MIKDDSILLGIDFGTSTTSAVVAIGSDLYTVQLGDGMEDVATLPTAVYVEGPGRFLVGDQAINASQNDPSVFHESFKRKIGASEPIHDAAGSCFTYTDLAAAVLRHVRLAAEHDWNNGNPIRSLVLTVPLLYVEGGDSWLAMEAAARQAGFEDVRLLREPHAAAILYQHLLPRDAQERCRDGEITLVYDLGGGTFDPALLEHTARGFRILGSGDAGIHCGGTYFDEVLLEDFRAKCASTMERLRLSPAREGDSVEVVLERSRRRFSFLQISEFLRKAKHRLSRPECTEFREKNPVTGEEYAISKGEFETLILPLVETTMAACASMVERSGVGWARITRFLMVGGSCRIPLVRKRLEALARDRGAGGLEISCGRIGTTDRSYDPALAVSLGAALDGQREWIEARYREGDRHYFGQGVPQDYVEAEKSYRAAAELGNAEAQYGMGVLFTYGRGVPKDLAEAARWYRKASEQGHAEAQANLGQLLIVGSNGTKDFQEAFRWLLPAAQANSAKAQHLLGVLFRSGQGVAQDHKEAVRWLQAAVDQGYSAALNDLAYLHQIGSGVARDLRLAADLYRRSAEAADAHAQFSLGLLLQSGQGVGPDPIEAEKWFRLAADQGHAQAQHHLGVLLSRRNSAEAVAWLQKAGQGGVAASLTWLAELLVEGKVVAKDLAAARRLFETAKSMGDPKSIEVLRRMDASTQTGRTNLPSGGGMTPPLLSAGQAQNRRIGQKPSQTGMGRQKASTPPPLPPRTPPTMRRTPPPLPPGCGPGQPPGGRQA